jgi:hypothetical protein
MGKIVRFRVTVTTAQGTTYKFKAGRCTPRWEEKRIGWIQPKITSRVAIQIEMGLENGDAIGTRTAPSINRVA